MRRFSICFLLILLQIAGCKGESSEISGTVDQKPSPPAEQTAFALTGRVVFGFAENAEVRVYGGASGTELIASTVSGPTGTYHVTVDSKYLFEPAVIEASIKTDDTVLLCTSTLGCANDVQFGEAYSAREDITLFTAVSRLQRDVPQYISVLTDLAYAQAAEGLAVSRATSGPSDALNRQLAYATANSQIASRFKINGDLTSQGALDFTNQVEVLSGWRNALLFSVMGASLVEAAQLKLGIDSAIVAYQHFKGEYLERGLADNTAFARVVSYADALQHVLNTLERYESDSSYVTSLASELAAARAVSLLEKPDQYDNGTASDTIGLSSIEKGKSFVENIRQVASSIDLNKLMSLRELSGFLDGAAAGALDDFGVKIEAAEILNGQEPQYLIEALKKAAKSVFGAATQHYFGDAVGSSTYDGIFVAVEDRGEEMVFVVNQLVSVCDSPQDGCVVNVDLAVAVSAERLSGSADGLALAADEIRLDVSGSLTSSTLSMEFAPGQKDMLVGGFYVTLDEVEQPDIEQSSFFIEADNLEAEFRMHVMRSDPDDVTSVNALVEVNATDIALELFSEKAKVVSLDEATFLQSRSVVIDRMGELKVNLGAVIERSYEESFLAGVNARATKPEAAGIMEYSASRVEICSLAQEAECTVQEETSSFVGESEQSFLQAEVSTLFKAHLKGVVEPVFVQISGSREAANRNKLDSLKVTYPGHALSLSGQFNNKGGITSMNATNLDGMRMYIDSEAGKREGAVTGPGGEPVGVIEDGGEWVKIRFTDGYFVSM